MKVLVTGGAGFIGSHIVKKLIELNNTVITLDDLSTGKQSFLSEVMNHPNHTFVNGSVLNRNLLESLIDQCELVFHLAAVLGVKNTVENPLKVIEGNIDGTRNVLELAYPKRLKSFFHPLPKCMERMINFHSVKIPAGYWGQPRPIAGVMLQQKH